MTWSTFALFLARRTIGLLASFQVSLIFDLFWSHCFGWNRSKVVKGSKLRNTFMHVPRFFSIHFLTFSIPFPKLTIFISLRLYMACKMWKITVLTWEISSWRLVEKSHICAFPMYYSLYNWTGEHEITKLKKYIYLLRIQKKWHKNKHKKTLTKCMEWHKMDYLILSAMCMRKHHLFCTSSHHNVPYEKQQEVNKGSEPWNECSCKSACAIAKYALR